MASRQGEAQAALETGAGVATALFAAYGDDGHHIAVGPSQMRRRCSTGTLRLRQATTGRSRSTIDDYEVALQCSWDGYPTRRESPSDAGERWVSSAPSDHRTTRVLRRALGSVQGGWCSTDQLDQVDQVQGVGRGAAPGSGPCAARAARRLFEWTRGEMAGGVTSKWKASAAWPARPGRPRGKTGTGPSDQGRARRDPTPVQRIEIDRRDKGCRFPGCSYTEFTNVHHIVHWVDGGLTNLANLVTLCCRHHRAVHELGWAMSGNADAAVTFTSPHGRSAKSVPSPSGECHRWTGTPIRR